MPASQRYLQQAVMLLLVILLSSLFLASCEAAPMYPLDNVVDLGIDIDAAVAQWQATPESDQIPELSHLPDNHRAGPLQSRTQTGPQRGPYRSQQGRPYQPAAVRPRLETWNQQSHSSPTPTRSYGGQPGSMVHPYPQTQPHFDLSGSTSGEGSPYGEMYPFPVLEYGILQADGVHTPTEGEGSSSSNEIWKGTAAMSRQGKGEAARYTDWTDFNAQQKMLEKAAEEKDAMAIINRRLSNAVDDAERKRALRELGAEYFPRNTIHKLDKLSGSVDEHGENESKARMAVFQGSAEQMALVRKVMELRMERLVSRRPNTSSTLEWNFRGSRRNFDLFRNGIDPPRDQGPNLEPDLELETFILGDFQIRLRSHDHVASAPGVIGRIHTGADVEVSVFAVPKKVTSTKSYKGVSIFVGNLHFAGTRD